MTRMDTLIKITVIIEIHKANIDALIDEMSTMSTKSIEYAQQLKVLEEETSCIKTLEDTINVLIGDENK